MYDGTNFLHFFSSNNSFHPENKGFLVIIGSIFDRGTSAYKHECQRFFLERDVGYGDEGKHGKKGASFISDLLLGKNW